LLLAGTWLSFSCCTKLCPFQERGTGVENKFTIGQMSKLHNVPVKTLRYYDDIGLFKANEVDPDTGYRYYTVGQFKLLDLITYLKMLGVPLKEIKKQVYNRDIRELKNVLYKHKQITEMKIQELELAKKKIEERIREIEVAENITEIGVPIFKTLEERIILQLHEQIRNGMELELSLRKIKSHSYRFASIIFGKVGFTLAEEQIRQENYSEYSSIFLLLEKGEKDILPRDFELMAVLPAGEYACIYYRGAHSDASPYVKQLYEYLLAHRYRIRGDFLIRNIIDQYASHNADEHLSEIQVWVEKSD